MPNLKTLSYIETTISYYDGLKLKKKEHEQQHNIHISVIKISLGVDLYCQILDGFNFS